MNKHSFLVLTFGTMLCISGCEKKPREVYIDTASTTSATENDSTATDYSLSTEEYNTVSYDAATSGEDVAVPYREQNGVKILKVRVNGFPFDMIFDTGCSTTLISLAEAQYLYQKGALSKDDFQGTTQSQVATGELVENMVVVLREVVIGDGILCHNVVATIANNAQAPLLLGNEVLNRAPSYTIDNTNQQLIFHLQ